MEISTKAKEFIKGIDTSKFGQYISPLYFDSSFMSSEENAVAKKALVYSALSIVAKIGSQGLFKITFREAESFLRDDPRESAWPGVLDLKKWFETIFLQIQREYLDNLLMNNKVELCNWEELTLRQRIDQMQIIVENINSALDELAIGNIALFSVEENEITLEDMTQFVGLRPLSANEVKELVFECLAKYINFSCQSKRIKLVAQ